MQDGSPDPQQRAIVPFGSNGRVSAPRAPRGAIMLALSLLVSLFLPFAGIMLTAYGMRELAEARGSRGLAIALAEGLALLAVSFLVGPGLGFLLAPIVVCCWGISACMWRTATVTNVSVAIVVAGLVGYGVDVFIAAASGTSVHETAVAYLMQGVRDSVGTGVSAELVATQLEPLVEAIWPLMYVLSAMMDGLLAGIGSFLFGARCGRTPQAPSIARFDAPMWSVGVLAISVVCLGASFTGFPEAEVLRTVSFTVLMSVRFIFACQGFGVVSALMARKRIGCFTRTVCIFLLFWSEAMFFLMSIVGLIDVWANFRRLPRDGSHAQAQQ